MMVPMPYSPCSTVMPCLNMLGGKRRTPFSCSISKLAAGRKKDFDYVGALIRHKIVSLSALHALMEELDKEPRQKVAASIGLLK